MTNKSVAIIIDDFSDRVFEYNNVTVYDYGSLTITNSHDYFYNIDSSFDGYGVNSVDSDYIETLYFHENDFFKITPTYNSNFDYIDDFLDIDVINLTDQQQALYNLFGTDVFQDVYSSSIAQDSMGNLLFDYFGYPYLNTVSNNIIREGTSSTYEVCHGDWVLEAFYSSLERPELTEIICIDIDTLNGGYVNAVQYSDLFTIENSILDPTFQATNLENIIVDFLQNKGISFAPEAVNQDMYSISGLSVSLAGSMAQEEIPSLELMEFLQAPIIQAAPNVNQGLYDWGSNYPDVINVGAWNVAANEEFLLSSLYTIDTVDIVADGYIFKNEWGSNFGTSFATPRVTAEITNAVNDYLFETNLNNETLTTIADSPAIDYSNLVNSLVGYISEPVLINIYNDNNIYSLNVLSETINDNGLEPVYTPTVASGLEGVLLENVQLAGLENPSDDPPPPPPPNNDPYFTYDVDARDYFTFQELSSVASPIGSVFAADDDGDELVFSITGGSGQPYFEIEKITNQWGTYGRIKTSVRDELDFDTFKDIYEIKTNIPDNPYEHVILDLEISVTDGYSVVSRTVYAAMFNNPSDDPVPNQAPTNIYLNDNTGPVSVSENEVGGFIANLSGYDPEDDNLTYTVLSDYDGDMLEVNGSTLKFKDGVAADYEQSEVLHFMLRAKDPEGLSYDKEFHVNITNDPYDDSSVNNPPSSLQIESMSVYENLIGEELGLISAYDPDGDDLIFELSGSQAFHFELIPYEGPAITLEGWQGVTLKLNDNWYYDFESLSNYGERSLTIKVSDPAGLSIVEDFQFEIIDDISDNPTGIPSHAIINSDLVWTNGSNITITIDTMDSPGGSVGHSGFNESGDIQQPAQVSFTALSDGNMAAVWAVDVWKDLGDGTWSSSSTINSDYDIFYRVFNPEDGTFVTDEVRVTESVESDYVASVTANDAAGFTINYNKALDNFGENYTYTPELDTTTFTASIDKWQSDGNGVGMDGPSMKLHRKDIDDEVGIDLTAKDGHPGHKHKEDMDKGNYELRVEHDQDTDGAINIDDVMGVLSISRGITQTTSDEHKLAADWNGDGTINIDDVMGVLSRSRGIVRDDEWRFYDKAGDKSLWDNATKTNKIDIVLEDDDQIDLTAILRGDVNASYNAGQHNRADPSPAPTPNYAPLPLNNDDELQIINPDIV